MSNQPKPMKVYKYLTEDGKDTTADDPNRLIWYAIHCGYWTDDWGKLAKIGPGIPCCPVCKCVGCSVEFKLWEYSSKAHDLSNNPGYHKFLMDNMAKCFANLVPPGLGAAWARHKASKN